METSKNMNIDNRIVVQQTIFDQTTSLRVKVNEILEEEKEKEKFEEEYNMLMNETIVQKSIGTR